jgi:hypothetical protein
MASQVTDGDLPYLRRCVELAAEAVAAGDFPFGSVLVAADGTVLAEDRNREVTVGDPTRHPEFALARWAAVNMTRPQRAEATVYTSGEHCPGGGPGPAAGGASARPAPQIPLRATVGSASPLVARARWPGLC